MQTIYKACLGLTGVVVVILCVGIGMGIGRRLDDNMVDYEAYDEDYVDNDASSEYITQAPQAGILAISGGKGVIGNANRYKVE